METTRNQRVAMTATGFATDDIHTLNAATVYSLASKGNGNTDGTGTFRYPDVVLESYLGRINYSYLGRYLLSTSLRLDRSSLFAKKPQCLVPIHLIRLAHKRRAIYEEY